MHWNQISDINSLRFPVDVRFSRINVSKKENRFRTSDITVDWKQQLGIEMQNKIKNYYEEQKKINTL